MTTKTKDFDKKMTEIILPKFAAAKGWTELMTVISNFKENLRKYSHFNLDKLTEKPQLARRLSNSLNPLLPGGLHEISIEVYSDIFENIRRHNNDVIGENLGLYCSGLLPFFNPASTINKSIFLEKIVNLHFLNLNTVEINYLLPGLIASLLPGLSEQNDALIKELKDIFIKLREKVSDSTFFGTLWTVILRTPKLRLVGIKYINEIIPYCSNDQEETEQVVQKYYPNLNCLVINSIKSLIEDSEVLTQRSIMDFLIAKLPINNKIMNEEEKIAIITSTLKLLIKNEHSLTRRLFNWLLNSADDEPEMGDATVQYMLELMVKAIKLIFHSNDHKFGMSVLDLLFKHQAKFVEYILPEVSWALITSLYHNRRNEEIISKAKKFFEFDSFYLEIIWKAFGKICNPINMYHKDLMDFHNKINEDLENQIKMIKTNFLENQDNNNEIGLKSNSNSKSNNNNNINNNSYNNSNINNNNTYNIDNTENSEEENKKNLVILPFIIQYCLEEFYIRNLEEKYNCYLPIISNLLFHISSEKIRMIDEIKNIKNVLGVTLNLTIDMYYEEEKAAAEILIGKSVNRYTNVSDKIKTPLKENVKLFEKFYIQIINYLLVNSNIDEDKLRLFQNATELVLKVQIYKDREQTPEWLVYLIKLIFTTSNVWLSLEALEFILDLLNMKNENDEVREIKLFMRQESLAYILDLSNKLFFQGLDYSNNNNEKLSKENENTLDKIVGGEDYKSANPLQRNRNALEYAMAKLWRLIPDQSVQKKVTDILIKFSTSDPDLFSNAVSSTLNSTDLEEMVAGINTFTQFWKLTSEYYPEKRFFVRGECIFKILDYLDHPHPLIRHVSKSWLSQTTEQFNKVLDPLLLVLLDPGTKYYLSPNKTLIITDVYDSKRILEAFRKLKNIIVNFSEYQKVLKYLATTKPRKEIIDLCEYTEKSQHQGVLDHVLGTYLDLLVHIAMRFIKGKFVESVSKEFYKEHFSVKAASCEFLEYLLLSVENKTKVLEIAGKISEPVLYILFEKIIYEEVVMQVQLMNLLKSIILSTEPVHKEIGNKEIIVRILSSKILHNCLNLGITTDYIFVRIHFMNFLECCFSLFKSNLTIEDNLRIGNKLLITCSAFLVKRVDYFSELNKKKIFRKDKVNSEYNALNSSGKLSLDNSSNKNDSNINKEIENKTNSSSFKTFKKKLFIIKNYLLEYAESRSYDENDICTILKGIKSILLNFLDIKNPINKNSMINWQDVKSKIIVKEQETTTGYLLNYFINKTKEIADTITNTESNNVMEKEIILEIFSIFEEVFKSFLKCWISNSSNYMTKDLCLSNISILKLDESSNMNFTDQNLIGERLSIKQAYETVRDVILNINLNLIVVSPMEYFAVILKIWFDEEFHKQNKQNKILLIEIIASLNMPMSCFLKCLMANTDASRITTFTKAKLKIKGIYPFIVSYDNAEYESKICHFIFSFISYTKYFETCWDDFILFFELFSKSKLPSTWIWLFEIMSIILLKHPVNKTYKAKLKEIFEALSLRLFEFALLAKIDFTFDKPGKIIHPLPPTLYENVTLEKIGEKIFSVPLKKKFNKDNKSVFVSEHEEIEVDREILNQMRVSLDKRDSSLRKTSDNMSISKDNDNTFSNIYNNCNNNDNKDFLKQEGDNLEDKNKENNPISIFYNNVYENVIKEHELRHEELTKLYRITAFVILKDQYYNIIRQINPPEKIDKAIIHMQEIIKHLLTVLNKKVGIELIYINLSTEFLGSLFSKSNSQLSNIIKPGLLSFFYDMDFFKMSRRSLKHWMNIIRDYAQFQPKLLEEMLEQFNLGYGPQINKNLDADRVKIILLRRISFIVYSCDKDNFKINFLLEKIKEILTKMNDNIALEAEVFLLIRIMFLKFSKEQLIELLRNLWPIIFAEIAAILFNKKKDFSIDLPLSCLKLIECLSLANMEEFCLYQWSLVLDCK